MILLVRRPNALSFAAEGRLHNATGQFIESRNGSPDTACARQKK
jgi:hypothetical protein